MDTVQPCGAPVIMKQNPQVLIHACLVTASTLFYMYMYMHIHLETSLAYMYDVNVQYVDCIPVEYL